MGASFQFIIKHQQDVPVKKIDAMGEDDDEYPFEYMCGVRRYPNTRFHHHARLQFLKEIDPRLLMNLQLNLETLEMVFKLLTSDVSLASQFSSHASDGSILMSVSDSGSDSGNEDGQEIKFVTYDESSYEVDFLSA
ncbi:hypothetical protein M8C21_023152 [Ambrosia artemisiifolia]|uniref:Uncharacterized protein n=1 Tax=Ambrosia artemisiifolia TaxID=4212 RepID=A0AAD5GTW3_AMBAR|nr:hypothetical protein M8C21_023152 [Ambrosia artemisiifolia]